MGIRRARFSRGCAEAYPLDAGMLAYGAAVTAGYGDNSSSFAIANVGPSLRNYVMWLPVVITPIGMLALGLPLVIRMARVRIATLLGWIAVFLIFYAFYFPTYGNSKTSKCQHGSLKVRNRGVSMFLAILFAATVAAAPDAAQTGARAIGLHDLTVPTERLPAECVLSPAPSVRLDGNRFRGGFWANLPIPTNPWAGTDALVVASIRERIDPPVVPDGPPPTSRELARFRLKMAEGAEAAYAAIYTQSESDKVVVVQALKFTSAEDAVNVWTNARARNPSAVRLASGTIVALVSGDGECFEAVKSHVKSLAK